MVKRPFMHHTRWCILPIAAFQSERGLSGLGNIGFIKFGARALQSVQGALNSWKVGTELDSGRISHHVVQTSR